MCQQWFSFKKIECNHDHKETRTNVVKDRPNRDPSTESDRYKRAILWTRMFENQNLKRPTFANLIIFLSRLLVGLPKKLVDVIFVMGSANPNAMETFSKEKEIVNNMVETPKDAFAHYGIVQFGKTGETKIPLGDHGNKKTLKERVKKLPWKEGKSLDNGIKTAGKEFEDNGRPKARKVLVVFIDGNDDSTKDKLKKEAEPLKKKNIKIVPVILGENVDKEKVKPFLPKKKKPKKGKDPKRLSEQIAEETFNGENLPSLFRSFVLFFRL